jgi:hypothetical protein
MADSRAARQADGQARQRSPTILETMPAPIVLGPDTVVVASKGPVSCVVGDALVILDPATGNYFGTEAVGARIFAIIAEPTPMVEVCRHVAEEYEVTPQQAASDVDAFLRALIERGLAKTCAGGVAG